MSKLILFADDDAARTVLAYQRMTDDNKSNTIWCRTVEETIQTLWDYREAIGLVSFGHDFEGMKFMDTRSDKCGMEIVRWLENLSKTDEAEFKLFKDMKFISHTWNVGAGLKTIKRLQDIGINAIFKPFGS